MSNGLEIDFESRSDVNLLTRGVSRYMRSPLTEPLMASYQINRGPVRRWRRGEPCPADIVAHVEAGGMVAAHNCTFERLLWQLIMTPRYGWPVLKTEQCRCTAATAAALGLPRSLEALGAALGLKIQKDKVGKSLIQKFSIPRKPNAEEKALWKVHLKACGNDILAAERRAVAHGHPPLNNFPILFNEPEDHPEDFERFHDYCDDDVRTEAEADERMIPLSDYEQDVYVLDQKINDRGIRIDRRSALAAIRLAEKTKLKLDQQMAALTKGAVRKCSEVAKLLDWIKSRGVELGALAKADILDMLDATDLPDDVREALGLRQQAAKTSVSKLKTMLLRADDDGRVRHSFLYHKASTGRWQSVGVNFGNLPRPRKVYQDAYEENRLDIAQVFEAFRAEDPDLLEALYGPDLGRPLDMISDSLRGFLWSGPGKKLVQCDYSSIEGCVIAWSSGEQWKVEAMHEIFADPKNVPDMYRRAAAGIMNMTTDEIHKKHPLRQSVGKVSELALGYGGGVSAFYSMSRNYGVELDPLFPPVWENASEEARERAVKRYANSYKRGTARARELSREAWIACELIKTGWRKTNPAISKGWQTRESAVREAVENPGIVVPALKVSYIVAHGFLFCMLPSGRCLAYAGPRLTDNVWVKILCDDGTFSDSEVMPRDEAEKLAAKGKARIEGDSSQSVSILGLDKTGRKLKREKLYGGILAENDTQAIARDILVHGMFKAEDAGYPVIGHVYDEMFAEVANDFGDLKKFEKLICEHPEWAIGLPLQSDGWTGKRYRK